MIAKTVELSEAIVAAINSHEGLVAYEVAFFAERRSVPFDNVKDLAGLRVVVFDGVKSAERTGRSGTANAFTRTYKPTIAVLQKIPSTSDGDRKTLIDRNQIVVEQIEDVLEDLDLAGLTFVGFDEEQDRDPYNVETLKANGCFVVAIGLEYSS